MQATKKIGTRTAIAVAAAALSMGAFNADAQNRGMHNQPRGSVAVQRQATPRQGVPGYNSRAYGGGNNQRFREGLGLGTRQSHNLGNSFGGMGLAGGRSLYGGGRDVNYSTANNNPGIYGGYSNARGGYGGYGGYGRYGGYGGYASYGWGYGGFAPSLYYGRGWGHGWLLANNIFLTDALLSGYLNPGYYYWPGAGTWWCGSPAAFNCVVNSYPAAATASPPYAAAGPDPLWSSSDRSASATPLPSPGIMPPAAVQGDPERDRRDSKILEILEDIDRRLRPEPPSAAGKPAPQLAVGGTARTAFSIRDAGLGVLAGGIVVGAGAFALLRRERRAQIHGTPA